MADSTGGAPGLFIVIDGPDGCGKSTQAQRLARRLEPHHRVILTHEPGATDVGAQLRQIAMSEEYEMDARTELFLMLANRSDHISKIIKPALNRGEIVICDRFSESTIVYQSIVGGLDLGSVLAADAIARGGLEPAITIVLDADVNLLKGRINTRHNSSATKYDMREPGFFESIRAGFRFSRDHLHRPFHIVDGSADVDHVHERIWDMISDLLT